MNNQAITEYMHALGKTARTASRAMARASTATKNLALRHMADLIEQQTDALKTENAKDLAQARAKGLDDAFIDRLTLSDKAVSTMIAGLRQVAELPDPIGQMNHFKPLPSGITVGQMRVPLGVIGIIYESRPNVTADASALCFKSGNAVILRGGKEALESNKAIMTALQSGLADAGFAKETLQLIPDPSRELASEFMKMNGYLDCLIPRGGAGLIQNVLKNATVPVIETGVGNCHLYIDKDAELEMATRILVNAKCSRPSVCNSIETLVVHEAIANAFLPVFAEALAPYKVELRGDAKTCSILSEAVPATEEDFAAEFSDFILAVKVVSSYDDAIAHIQKYSTGHSEVIVTDHYQTAQNFLNDIDAAAVYINASSRFTDGGCFGFGGEIGISTQKLHARGPMGLKELTSYKYIIYGEGQIRS